MKKLLTILISFLALNYVNAAGSKQQEIGQKIQEIDREIQFVDSLMKGGDNEAVFKNYRQNLELEKIRYQKLSLTLKKISQKEHITTSPDLEKVLPTTQADALEDLKEYQDATVPVETRYELILKELSSTMTILNVLRNNEANDEETKKFIGLLEKKSTELEKLKLDYELSLLKSEQNELAEMKKTGVRVGAMLDFYYQWDFNTPSKSRDDRDLQYKNYNTKHNDFTIQLAEINLLKTYKNLDFYMDLDFGEMAEQNKSHTDDPITHHLGQALLRYRVPEFENTTLTIGKFYTHFGLEVPKSIENRNYSRPFYFTMICPFWHEGIALTRAGMGNFGAGVYIYDKTDDRIENNAGKTYGFQLNYSEDKFSGIYNFITGAEKNSEGKGIEGNDKTMHEVILSYNASENLTFVVDALVGKNKNFDAPTGKDHLWSGIVTYADLKTSGRNSLCLRAEKFSDHTATSSTTNLFSTASNPVDPTTVYGYTLTNRYNLLNGSEIRLEYRLDTASEDIFPKNKKDYDDKQNTVTVAWLYSI